MEELASRLHSSRLRLTQPGGPLQPGSASHMKSPDSSKPLPDDTDDLEASETWDWPAASKRRGVAEAGVTVSVRYSVEEFEAVAECAEREDLSVADFIRDAALEAARRRSSAR